MSKRARVRTLEVILDHAFIWTLVELESSPASPTGHCIRMAVQTLALSRIPLEAVVYSPTTLYYERLNFPSVN